MAFLFKILLIWQKLNHNIGFKEKRQYFRRKWAKIAETSGKTRCRLVGTTRAIFLAPDFSRHNIP
jgi:hypothetical protein